MDAGPDADSEELTRFREQWKAEVTQRAHGPHKPVHSESALDLPAPHLPVLPTRVSSVLTSAVETYRLAIRYEQAGDLDEALRLYRNAFRLDSNADKAYRREELILESAAAPSDASPSKENSGAFSFNAPKSSLTRPRSKVRQTPQKQSVTGLLVHLISSFPPNLDFEPYDETTRVLLRLIPDEAIILILKALDPHSVERFAQVNRKARVLSLDTSIWRDFVQRTYVPPQIPGGWTIHALAEQYSFDYRRCYVEHPRLRIDGVYIAVCHYVRPGMNTDNVWVHVSHLITYHRYLRFLPDGSVLSLLANEDVEPQTIIPLLKPSLRMKGLFIGNWSLEGTTIQIRDLMDPNGRNVRYTFQMTLSLTSRPLGRWNRLDLSGYDSVNVENGEAVPLGLKHERPFWFSKVRSYST